MSGHDGNSSTNETTLQRALKLLSEGYGRVEHYPDCKKRRAQSFRKAITDCTCGTSDWFDRANSLLDDAEALGLLPQVHPE